MLHILLFVWNILGYCSNSTGNIVRTTGRKQNVSGTVIVSGTTAGSTEVNKGNKVEVVRVVEKSTTGKGESVVEDGAKQSKAASKKVIFENDENKNINESSSASSSSHTVVMTEEHTRSTNETSEEKEVKARGLYADAIPETIAFQVYAKRIHNGETEMSYSNYTKTMREEIQRLREEIKTLSQKRNTQTVILQAVEQPEERSAIEYSTVQHDKELEILKQRKETLINEYQKLVEIHTRSTDERAYLETEVKTRREELAKLREEYERMGNDGSFEGYLQELERLYEQNENRIKQLEQEIRRLRGENNKLENEYDESADVHMKALERLLAEIKAIEQEIQQMMSSMDELMVDVEEQMQEIESEIRIIEEQMEHIVSERKTVITRSAPKKVRVVQQAVQPVEVHHVIHRVEKPMIQPVEIHYVVRPVTKVTTKRRMVKPVVKVVRTVPVKTVHHVKRIDNRVESTVKPSVKVHHVRKVRRVVRPVVREQRERAAAFKSRKVVLVKEQAKEHENVQSTTAQKSRLIRPERMVVLKASHDDDKKDKEQSGEPEEDKKRIFEDDGNAITRMRYAFWNMTRND